jgi:hypothetical protein
MANCWGREVARLSASELHDRLRLDYRVAHSLQGELVQTWAFASATDLKRRRNALVDEADGHRATHYLLRYHMRTLSGPGRFTEPVDVSVDLLGSGNYPWTEPIMSVVSRPMPWSPHFREGLPVCQGELWTSRRGEILLGHLVIHVAHLLNFDEEVRGGGYVGWNAEAIKYWTQTLGAKPLTPSLAYPVMDSTLTHGPTSPAFAPASLRRPGTTPFSGRRA